MAYSQLILVGKGKLATEVWSDIELPGSLVKLFWGDADVCHEKSIVIHAGSGREMPKLIEFCIGTESIIIELSAGSVLEGKQYPFPVVVCHNTNLLMLKFLQMLSMNGHMFSDNYIAVLESHQSTKKSAPGTALHIAKSLGLKNEDIKSVRDKELQISLGAYGQPRAPRASPHYYHRRNLRYHVGNARNGRCFLCVRSFQNRQCSHEQSS
nr:hypothetical protein [Pseudomonas sp.]